jgi:hypothetical protein
MTVTTSITDTVSRDIDALAERMGGRAALIEHLARDAAQRKTATSLFPARSDPQQVRTDNLARRKTVDITIRLDRNDLRRLDEESLDTGHERSQWIIALVRSHLHKKPKFRQGDRIILSSCVKQLRKIEASLAKATRALADREAPARAVLSRLDEIERFRLQVGALVRALNEAFSDNDAYWRTAIDQDSLESAGSGGRSSTFRNEHG